MKSDDKTVVYLTHGEQEDILKLDCGHARDVMDKMKFIVGSEIKLNHLDDIILYSQEENDAKAEAEGKKKKKLLYLRLVL